jgi:hypothetical protein
MRIVDSVSLLLLAFRYELPQRVFFLIEVGTCKVVLGVKEDACDACPGPEDALFDALCVAHVDERTFL